LNLLINFEFFIFFKAMSYLQEVCPSYKLEIGQPSNIEKKQGIVLIVIMLWSSNLLTLSQEISNSVYQRFRSVQEIKIQFPFKSYERLEDW